MIDWLSVKKDYIKDPTLSLRAVAAKYDINESYVMQVAADEGWKKEKDEIQAKAEQRLSEKMPETIADIKLRHARLGKNIQALAMNALASNKLQPTNYQEAVNGIVKGVALEREALGLNDKKIQDEIYQKFSQYTFIFNLSDDELRRFIVSAFSGTETEAGDTSPAPTQQPAETGSPSELGGSPVPDGTLPVQG